MGIFMWCSFFNSRTPTTRGEAVEMPKTVGSIDGGGYPPENCCMHELLATQLPIQRICNIRSQTG